MPGSNKYKINGSCPQNARAVDKRQKEERCPTLQEWHSPGVSEAPGGAWGCSWYVWLEGLVQASL